MDTNMRIDPRGLALSGLVGIAYLALGAPLPLAGGALALVYALNAAFTRDSERRPRPELPTLQPGAPETAWVERAATAVSSIEKLRRTARSDAIAQRCAAITEQGRLAVIALHRLAHQASVVAGLTTNTNLPELRAAEERARGQLVDATGLARFELDRTVGSLRARREAAERLEATRRDLGDRVQAGALGLEGVVARVAQIVALTDDTSRTSSIEELAAELDTLRDALIASEAIGDHAFTSGIAATEGER